MCWPADNVTALASLALHDTTYGTDYRAAYAAWKRWTVANLDPLTRTPAGKIDATTGERLQPGRGCGNAWILALLPRIDPPFAKELYGRHRSAFVVTRLGFEVVREWPREDARGADVDSGPIVLDAGVTATGFGSLFLCSDCLDARSS